MLDTQMILEASCYFMIYAMLGWVMEVIYNAAANGIVTNRGFLNGPVCPVYGFGSLAVLFWQNSLPKEPSGFDIFLFGMISATLIELAAGWILDKLFHARWWDYSSLPFNFHGYICLLFSLLWGIAVFVAIKGIHPAVSLLVHKLLALKYGWVFVPITYACFLADLIVTVTILIGLNRRFAELDKVRKEMRRFSDELSQELGTRAKSTSEQIQSGSQELKEAAIETRREMKQSKEEHLRALEETMRRRKTELLEKSGLQRILRAVPEYSRKDFPDLLNELRAELDQRKKTK